jgi:transposase InsO family protein|tara:strand:- start:60 stop:899 length:840 start_codon:yes stop_codon:yes gene_type:complete
MVSPAQKKQAVAYVVDQRLCSERRACRYLGVHRSTYRYPVKSPLPQQVQLHQRIVSLSWQYPRYGYRRIRAVLEREGWSVSRKQVQRIRRKEGLKVHPKPQRIPRQGVSTGLPTQATHRNHVWTWDFIFDRTDKGSTLKMLTMLDEYTRQCLAIRVERQIRSGQVLATLWQAMMQYGIPEHIRSDNGTEFIAGKIQRWLRVNQIKTLYIEPGSPWQNGYIESFHSRFRDECLNREWLLNLREARVVIEDWRQHYNTERPHSRLGYLSPENYIKHQKVSP